MKFNIRSKMFAAFGTLLALLTVVGLVGWNAIATLSAELESLYNDNLQAAVQLANAQDALWQLRYGFPQFLVLGDDDRAKIVADQAKWYEEIDKNLQAYAAGNRTDKELTALEKWESIFTQYRQARPRWFELQSAGKLEEAAEWRAQTTTPFGAGSVAALGELIDLQREVATAKEQEARDTVFNSALLLGGTTLLALVLGLAVAYFLTRNIVNPLRELTTVAQAVSVGNLDIKAQVTTRDETRLLANAFNQVIAYQQQMAGAANRLAQGDVTATITPQSDQDVLSHAFRSMIAYQQQMSEVADRLAQGDLTANVSPQSDKDVLGHAFSLMIINLRTLVSQIVETANTVGGASSQLAKTADQAGQASQQVTNTIQQVATGTGQQTQAVSEASGNVEQMARAANGIAKGAQEQAQSVLKTSSLIDQMSHLVEQVGQVARSASQANTKVTQVARQGVTKVEQTTQGMEAIRTRSITTSDKVREMSSRSKEIGRIVEAIDDIADKTDMLALNAAVEAARAGEYGRGFAVVAEQVRKLSEDAKGATRDIAGLIERVQESVREAIESMEGTLNEVINGTRLAGDTSKSLEEILQAAEEATVMAEQIGEAVTQLRQKSENVVMAIETVGTVVEENTAAAEEMAANSEEVMQIIGGVATVAEENSAAAEEVSASAEEMSAQIEEVVSSSLELASLAEQLRMAISQFQIEEANSFQAGQTGRSMAPVYAMTGPQRPRFMPAIHPGNGGPGEHRSGANPWKKN